VGVDVVGDAAEKKKKKKKRKKVGRRQEELTFCTSLESKRSSESDITTPLVFINSVESLRKSGSITAGRKALRRKNASSQSRMRRWKSDPGLGSATTESSQASFVELKKSLSFGSASKEALGKSLEPV